MVLGSLCSMGDITLSSGAVLRHPYPCGSMLKAGRGSAVSGGVGGGLSRCRGVAVTRSRVKPPSMSRRCSGRGAGSAPRFCLFIYRRNSSGRSIPETLLTAPALWWDHRHAAAAPAEPSCRAHPVPPAPWFLKGYGVKGRCAMVLALCWALCPTGMRSGGEWEPCYSRCAKGTLFICTSSI